MARSSTHPRSVIGLAGRIAAFIGASILAGALVAGVALPFAGGLGLTAKAASDNFQDLPADLAAPVMSQPSYIYDEAGNQLAMTFTRYRILVGSGDIAPIMKQSLVDIEDSRFYQHGPIDLKGTLRALVHNNGGSGTQGGSSLTQQYVKNIFIEEAGDDPKKVAAATAQTLSRKIKELKYAIGIEQKLTKDEILTNYLNITFFGEQSYGIEAAANRYFGVHANALNLTQAAMLAGLVQAPSSYDPISNPQAAIDRRNIVLQRMADLKTITQPQADAAKASPLGLNPQPLPNGCINANNENGAAFFCDYVEHVVKSDPAFGKTQDERDALWQAGGLKIVTTLDPNDQASAQNALLKKVSPDDSVASAMTMVEPGTGKIRAMAQTRPYGFGANETSINYSVDKSMGGSQYGFQTGSTFKAFTAAAYLESGGSVGQTYTTGSQLDMRGQKFTTCTKPVSDPSWQPKNESSSEAGTFDMETAIEKSVNSYFVLLSKDLGLCPIAQMAAQMGVHHGDGTPLDQIPSMTLGSNDVAPLTMAAAYATFPNRGTYCTPIAIESVTKLDGTKIPVPTSTCKQVMKPETADTINGLLQLVNQKGTGTSAALDDRQSAGKTGTTDDKNAAWYIGYTPQLVGAVWVGGPSGNVPMINIKIGGQTYSSVQGAELPAPIWKLAMSGAMKGVTPATFTAPPAGAIPAAPDQNANNGNGQNGQQPTPNTTAPANSPPGQQTQQPQPGNGNGNGNGNGGGSPITLPTGFPSFPGRGHGG